jgi:hypothetical protein
VAVAAIAEEAPRKAAIAARPWYSCGAGGMESQASSVSSAPAAECVTVRGGKIAYSRFIFDRAPFDAAREAARDSAG